MSAVSKPGFFSSGVTIACFWEVGSVIGMIIYSPMSVAYVGPGHCCFRIGASRLMARWRKRRPEPGHLLN